MLRNTLMAMAAIPVLVILSPLYADDAKDDAPRKDAQAMQGKWSIQSLTRDGKVEPIAKEAVRIIADDTYTMNLHPRLTVKGTYKIDATSHPKGIETTPSSGPYKEKHLLGIYEMDGDSLKICYALPGEERPTEFTSKAGSGWILTIHKKLKE